MSENKLRYTTPEAAGIPSRAICAFLDALREYRFPVHSFLLSRHGEIVAEGYCPPFDANRKHRMYSVSKSFTSAAIGMLIGEGKLSLDDPVASFFPEYLPENPSEYIVKATVRDLLMMATFNESNAYDFDSPDFTRAFFDNELPKQMPGAVFHYDTNGTTVLCAIVEKLAGMPMLAYMRPVLDKIGFSEDVWCIQTPEGRSWTGSGILATPRDLLRFALLCLHKGEWMGETLISKRYMEEATSLQIDSSVADYSYTMLGYGYQFWIMKHGGFALNGMGGKFAFVMPQQDMVLVMTGDNQGISGADDAIRALFYRLLASATDGPLEADVEAQAELSKKLKLSLPLPAGRKTSPVAENVNGAKYAFDENRFGFRWMQLDFDSEALTLTYEKPTGVHRLKLYLGQYRELTFPEPHYGARIGAIDRYYRCVSAAAWERENTLIGKLYAVDDYLGVINWQFTFVGDTLTVFMTKAAEAFFMDYRGYLAGRRV